MTFNQDCGVHEISNVSCDSNMTHPPSFGMAHDSTFTIVVKLYLIGLIGIIGLLGNIVSLVVLRQDKERRETLLLLQALALSDALYVIVALLRYPLAYFIQDPHMYHTMQLYVFPLLKTFQAITIWMLVLVTVDRFIYVCKPLRAQEIFNHKTRRRFAVLVFVFGILFSLPRFFDSCIMVFTKCNMVELSRKVPKPAFKNTYYSHIYQYAMWITFLYVIPLAMLFYMNIGLIIAIRKSKQRHNEMRVHGLGNSRTNNKYNAHTENNATLVLVIIILVFIVCETPECILRILNALEQNKILKSMSKTFLSFNTLSALFMVINSSVNFFIYFLFGKRFRYIMKETFIFKLQTSMTFFTRESVPLNRQNQYAW